ncbi:hypothetical protein M408DRAFT_327145 [Serendipita vermifera MAFF 305830]|uniref:Uncharacterized protein n=1 Tax=Serendipita vermifera MAFF 305830 TaxID=933852 RepID=A0A0C3BJP1_SERVB|nr:hypothetical protein M408DRAFT_327145 [Serendipita vermifera MAFF 305830]
MCHKLEVTDVFQVCGHTRTSHPTIDCKSPNCARSNYHTTQSHNCLAICKQTLQLPQAASETHNSRCGQC